MPNFLEPILREALQARRDEGLLRQRPVLESPQGTSVCIDNAKVLSFCSNDYLGLANHPAVVKAFQAGGADFGVGSGASHLISGHSRAHHQLEEELAEFTGSSKAVLFSSGYMANVGVITTLLNHTDCIVEDRLNHASLLDGGIFSQARFSRYPHLDYAGLERRLDSAGDARRRLVVTDGIFSMDGDMVDLPEILKVSEQKEALVMMDDAHGFGCLGPEGSGTAGYYRALGERVDEHNCHILVGTLGKAFGTAGAFVAGSEALIETLIQFCRPYIYTTAMPAAVAQATRASLKLLRQENWRREKLQDFIRRFRRHCHEAGFVLTDSSSPIQAIILGEVDAAIAASRALADRGLFVSAIRPPTVPKGTARLRITFSAAHTEQEFTVLLEAIEQLAGIINR